MKNLFKNLMLVAVAAMAFTACQNDNNEVNEVAKKTVISGVLSFDEETRSGFVGKNEAGDAYVSEWDGDETIKLFANGLETTATVDEEGKFTAQFEGELPESFFMTVCSPAESWSSQSTSTIPAEQTPRANSVDPKAHLLQAQNVQVSNGTADAIVMSHQPAYGKMTVKGVDFAIDHVVVDIKGTNFGYDYDMSYTINATYVENNEFWFAVEYAVEVSSLTVTAYGAGDKVVAKTVDMTGKEKPLAFSIGQVSTFSVKDLEVSTVPTFTSAELTGDWFQDNQFTFVDDSGELLDLVIDLASVDAYNNNDTLILEGEYTIEDCYLEGYTKYGDTELGAVNIKVTHIQGGYHIEFSNIKDTNGNLLLERAIFEGPIIDYGNPDLRIQLATPSNVKLSVSGKDITVTWDKVDNAVKYSVECYDEETKVVTDTTVTFSLPNYEETYSFRITALAGESDKYRDSETTGWYNTDTGADPRTVLPIPTNIKATIDGRYATIEWDAVEGADYYQLSYNLNGNQTVDVAETSHTIDVGFGVSNLYVYVFAKANEDNPDYKSSESGSVVVNTGKDPNKFADNVATDLYFDGYGDLIFVVDAYETFKVRLNSADRPGNTTIKEGEYVGIDSGTVGAGKFSVYQKIKDGYSEGYTSTKTTSTMSVEYVDGQYLIIVNYVGKYGGSGEVGYKGVPNGWDAPVADTTPVIKVDQSSVELKRAGGSVDINVTLKNITDSIVAESNNAQFTTSVNGNVVTISAGENNTGAVINGVVTISAGGVSTTVSVQQVAEDIVLEVNWSYSFDSSSSGVYGHVWNVSGKDLDGYDISAQITMDSRNGYTSSSNFTPGTYSYHAQYADGNFGSGMWFTMRNINFRGTQYSNYDVTGTITVEVEGGRTKVTADIYNLVNGYTTTKITTFVGYLN